MTQVLLLMANGTGNVGLATQVVMVPVVVGVWVAVLPIVSTSVPGLKFTTGAVGC